MMFIETEILFQLKEGEKITGNNHTKPINFFFSFFFSFLFLVLLSWLESEDLTEAEWLFVTDSITVLLYRNRSCQGQQRLPDIEVVVVTPEAELRVEAISR
jgi:hypothetical protein